MDIFTADITSLQLLRLVRCGSDLRLAQTDVDGPRTPVPPESPNVKLCRLGIPALCNLLGIPHNGKLHLLVPRQTRRARAQGITLATRSYPPSKQALLEVTSTDPRYPSKLLPVRGRLFVESPPAIVLGMAAMLTRFQGNGKLCHQEAFLRLLKLCLELCGTYSLDPLDPHGGDCRFNLPTAMCAQDLKDFTDGLAKRKGMPLVKEVLPHVFELSGSPQESYLGSALFCPTLYGGLQLGAFAANEQLDLNPTQRRAIVCKQLTPDFSMTQYRLVIEYNGSVHDLGEMPERDRIKLLDYQTLGYLAFVFVNRDVGSVSALNASARRIVAAIAQYEGESVLRAFQELVTDEEFAVRQQLLHDVFRPAVNHDEAEQVPLEAYADLLA